MTDEITDDLGQDPPQPIEAEPIEPVPGPAEEPAPAQEAPAQEAPAQEAPAPKPGPRRIASGPQAKPQTIAEQLREQASAHSWITTTARPKLKQLRAYAEQAASPKLNQVTRQHALAKAVGCMCEAIAIIDEGLGRLDAEKFQIADAMDKSYGEAIKTMRRQLGERQAQTITAVNGLIRQVNTMIIEGVDRDLMMRALVYALCERDLFAKDSFVLEATFDANFEALNAILDRIFPMRVGLQRQKGPKGQRLLEGDVLLSAFNFPKEAMAK